MALGIFNPETIKGLIAIFLLIWILSGRGIRVLSNLIRKAVGLRS